MELFCSLCYLKFGEKVWYDLHLSIVHKIEGRLDSPKKENIFQNEEKGKKDFTPSEDRGSEKCNMKKHAYSMKESKNLFKCEICDYCTGC